MFDLSSTEPATNNFTPIPKGIYKLVLEKAELKDTKSGGGQYVACSFEIVNGEYAGRKIWNNFNTKNNNAQAVEIGMSNLRAMIDNSSMPNKLKFTDPSELCGLQVYASVGVEKNDETKNRIVYFVEKGFAEDGQMATASKKSDITTDDIPF